MENFIRVGAAIPKVQVADCPYNTREILAIAEEAYQQDVKVLLFPELSVTAYSCQDLFGQSTLLEAAESSIKEICQKTKDYAMLLVLGVPVRCQTQLFNCAAVLYQGQVLGLVPKTFLPNYSEFYEKRWFSSALDLKTNETFFCGHTVPIGADLLFQCKQAPEFTVGIEVCEDLWAPAPPSAQLAMAGATVLLNPSASNELATKQEYRKDLVSQQSARCISAYLYASSGLGESTQDTVFSGHAMIYENGVCLKESKRFYPENQLIVSDIDVEALCNDRRKNSGFSSGLNRKDGLRTIPFSMELPAMPDILQRTVSPLPFIPANADNMAKRCQDIFYIQVTGLAKRLIHTKASALVVGISGGLDSTLALLVCVRACDFIHLDRKHVIGITMPGFGTTDRTYQNALSLMKALGVTVREISIKESCLQHFQDIGHDPSIHDVTYENTQARERTQILMDVANQENGLVVGTGDLSELALGWATYNGDHMSMYGVNAGVPKTLVRVLVNWVASSQMLDKESVNILLDVLDTPVSPELLPPDAEGKINQKTEEIVGPYELHDFFLFYVVRYGFSPRKIFYLAKQAFGEAYEEEIILKWLQNFYRRFFSQQFKRSCLPDGPKVGTISLSPRGDWRMPSDAVSQLWLAEVQSLLP